MWNSRSARFSSAHYPKSGQAFFVLQDVAMRFYLIFMLVVMAAVMIQIYNRNEVILVGIIGSVVAIALANFAAYVVLHRRIAEIFFVNDSFSVISVYDILYKVPQKAFPLRFANPTRAGEEIQFHYLDQIMILRREDWEEFELVWNWLNQAQMDFTTHTLQEEPE